MGGEFLIVSRDPFEVVFSGGRLDPRLLLLGMAGGLALLGGLAAIFLGEVGAVGGPMGGAAAAMLLATVGALDGRASVYLSRVRRLRVIVEDGRRELEVDGCRLPADAVPRVQVGLRPKMEPESNEVRYSHVVVVPLVARGVELRVPDRKSAVDLAELLAEALDLEGSEQEPRSQNGTRETIRCAYILTVSLIVVVGLLAYISVISNGASWLPWAYDALAIAAMYGIGRALAWRAASANLEKRLAGSEPHG